jgi:predicted  nucleic acid-binding Zn-ribbon protein
MDLTITLDDVATLVTTKKVFTDGVANETKKYITDLENKIMALKADLEVLKQALTDQGVAIGVEFEQVKAKFEALKNEIVTLKDNVATLETAVADLEGIDLSAEINAVKGSLATIDSISESDVPPAPPTA